MLVSSLPRSWTDYPPRWRRLRGPLLIRYSSTCCIIIEDETFFYLFVFKDRIEHLDFMILKVF